MSNLFAKLFDAALDKWDKSRGFRCILIFLPLAMTLIILYSIDASDISFSVAGGIIGAISSMIILISSYFNPLHKGPPYALLFWRAFCDFGLASRFIFTTCFNLLLCGTLDSCPITLANENSCVFPSAMFEFFAISSECWFLCNGIDLYYSITNPFSAFSSRMRAYHYFTWSVTLLYSIIPFAAQHGTAVYGFFIPNKYIEQVNALCWIKLHADIYTYPIWVFFLMPLICIYLYCLGSLYVAYFRLQRGISRTFLPRLQLLVANTTQQISLLLYWLVYVFVYLLTSASGPASYSKYFYNLLIFLIATKGFSALFVWVLMAGTVYTSRDEDSQNVDANQALRQEVLQFATGGIRSSARDGHKLTPGRRYVTRVPQQTDNEESRRMITPYFFFRFVLGMRDELLAVENMVFSRRRSVNGNFMRQTLTSAAEAGVGGGAGGGENGGDEYTIMPRNSVFGGPFRASMVYGSSKRDSSEYLGGGWAAGSRPSSAKFGRYGGEYGEEEGDAGGADREVGEGEGERGDEEMRLSQRPTQLFTVDSTMGTSPSTPTGTETQHAQNSPAEGAFSAAAAAACNTATAAATNERTTVPKKRSLKVSDFRASVSVQQRSDQSIAAAKFRATDVSMRPSAMVEARETEMDKESDRAGTFDGWNPFMWLYRAVQTNVFQASESVEFTEFEPYHFRRVRLSVGITDEIYVNYFSMTLKERLTQGGASGAFFFFSKGEKFIAKSCSVQEVEVLTHNAEKYADYLTQNTGSYISKIYGAYRLRIYGTSLYFFVMSNIFLNDENLVMNEKYDIKGSWVKRNAAPPLDKQVATCTHCEQRYIYRKKRQLISSSKPISRSDVVPSIERLQLEKLRKRVNTDVTVSPLYLDPGSGAGADSCPGSVSGLSAEELEAGIRAARRGAESAGEDLDSGVYSDSCPYTVTGQHEPNLVLKDNDLKFKIRLPLSTSIGLLRQLCLDADFLYSLGIMDYSLLVGVHNTEYEVYKQGGEDKDNTGSARGAPPTVRRLTDSQSLTATSSKTPFRTSTSGSGAAGVAEGGGVGMGGGTGRGSFQRASGSFSRARRMTISAKTSTAVQDDAIQEEEEDSDDDDDDVDVDVDNAGNKDKHGDRSRGEEDHQGSAGEDVRLSVVGNAEGSGKSRGRTPLPSERQISSEGVELAPMKRSTTAYDENDRYSEGGGEQAASGAGRGSGSESGNVNASSGASSQAKRTPKRGTLDLSATKKLLVERVVGPDAYYMGIIDFQQKWDFSKKMERFFKRHFRGEDPDGISAIEPEQYRDRFLRKIEDIMDFENLDRSVSVQSLF